MSSQRAAGGGIAAGDTEVNGLSRADGNGAGQSMDAGAGRSVTKGRHMKVCAERMQECIKPGGTAGDIDPVPAHNAWDRIFSIPQ